jgi:tetratricopeptide (TPR) repeat protein
MYAYNPRKKSYQQLEKSMVGSDKWDILNTILKEMNIKRNEGPKQHWMIIGPRGIGKSHLMTLLYHKVKYNQKLIKKWVPILFPEDLKLAGALHKILERTLNEIIMEIQQKEKERSIAAELKQRIKDIKSVPSSERANSFFDLLSWFYNETGKHTLLIAENLQHLLGKKIPVIEQKKLRAFLQTSDALLIIGSATTVFNALHDHGHPFYHFFHIRRLEDLDFEDMKTLLLDILSQKQQPELKSKVTNGNARLKALYSFTGGNPRMAVFLADILSTEVPGEMLELMDSILDELTPYFESILQGIADCFEEVINTLAAFEPAQSPSEIAKHLEMPQASIRNYLKQLKEDGHVRIAFSKGKSNYYCLNEYLYRIWYQMRDSSHREESRWLIELLLMLYSREYIVEEKSRLEACVNQEPVSLNYKKLIDDAVQYMGRYPAHCKVIERCVDSILPHENKTTEINARELNLLKKAKSYIDSRQYDHAIKLCEEVVNINSKTKFGYPMWGICLDNQGRHEEAIEKAKKAIELNPEWDKPLVLYGFYLVKQGKYEEAIKNLKKAIELNPKSEVGYWMWGVALREQGRYGEALEKYKKAAELNPEEDVFFGDWGEFLLEQGRYEEAITLFEKHIPGNRYFVGIYYYGKCLMEVQRYDDALKQFERLIDFQPGYNPVYLPYGNILEMKGDKENALLAYLKHIELGCKNFAIDVDFQVTYNHHISPLLNKINPGKYIKQFYHSEIKRKELFQVQSGIILVLLSKYDVVHEQIKNILKTYMEKETKEDEAFELLIFTFKLSMWLKLIDGNINDALKSTELNIEYIKALKSIEEKKYEVFNFYSDLFSVQIKFNIEAGNVQKVLKRMEDEEEIPFSNVIYKIWTCLSEPDSVEAQRYLNEKPIAEVVKQLKERVKSQKRDKDRCGDNVK